jgi:hypothetical protein
MDNSLHLHHIAIVGSPSLSCPAKEDLREEEAQMPGIWASRLLLANVDRDTSNKLRGLVEALEGVLTIQKSVGKREFWGIQALRGIGCAFGQSHPVVIRMRSGLASHAAPSLKNYERHMYRNTSTPATAKMGTGGQRACIRK